MRHSLPLFILLLCWGIARAQTEDPNAYAKRLNESPERDTAFDRRINEMVAEAFAVGKESTPTAREKIGAIIDRLLTYADTSSNQLTAQKAIIMSHPIRYHSGHPGYSIGEAMLEDYPLEVYREIYKMVYFGHLMSVTDRDYGAIQDSLEQLHERVTDPDRRRYIASRFILKPGTEAPVFFGVTDGGGTFSLDSLSGRVVLLEFWATHCAPCIAKFPDLTQMVHTYSGEDFSVVAISVDREQDKWRKFLADRALPWTQIYDGGNHYGPIALRYNNYILPQYFLIDREGTIVYNSVFNGHQLPTDDIIQRALGAR